MFSRFICLAIILLAAAPCRAQENVAPVVDDTQMPPLAPQTFPAPADVLPPAVPDRPPPPPPASAFVRPALQPPGFLGQAGIGRPLQTQDGDNRPSIVYPPKPPLSWRAKAMELNSDSQAPCRVVPGSSDEVTMSLLSSLPQFNLKVAVLNSDAGELLAVSTDPNNKQKVVFTINEMPEGTVTIKGVALPVNSQGTSLVQAILQALNTTATRRGTL